MARKKAAAAAPAEPPKQRLVLEGALHHSSSSKGGAAGSHAELVKRLTSVHDQLRDFDQDTVDTSSLDRCADELVDPILLLHKDKSVKALVAACIVDILRLYAPEAPYTPAQLHDLFEFLTNQLKYAGDPKDPNQPEHFYVVDSLASVKSIVLVCDLDHADQLLSRIFAVVFDTVSSQTPKNVTLALSDILLSLLDEATSIPPGVINALTAQFIPSRANSSSRASKGKDRASGPDDDNNTESAHERRAAFRLAVDVARAASDKLQRYVSQYFSETVLASVNGGNGVRGARSGDDDDEDDEMSEPESSADDDEGTARGRGRGKRRAKTKARAKLAKDSHFVPGGGARNGMETGEYASLPAQLVDAHRLIRSLNRHVPALLLNVIPQLAEELTSNEPLLRILATDFLGQMLGEPVGRGDLAKNNPGVWKEWLKRARDKDAKVRIKMCDRLEPIWREHPELAQDVEGIWISCLLIDHDEKVRLAACGVIDGVEYEMAKHHVSKRALQALADRLTDKKEKVRTMAFRTLGQLYDAAFTDIESGDEPAYNHFGWIPGRVLDSATFGETGQPPAVVQRNLVIATLADYITPLPEEKEVDDVASWVDRFLLVESSLATELQRGALLHHTHLAEKVQGSMWGAYLEACQQYNGGLVDDKVTKDALKVFLKKVVAGIAALMPDPEKATNDLEHFARENEAQLYRELKVMLDPQTDLKAFVKNRRDFLKRVGKFKSTGESVANTFSCFIRLACYVFINRSSIPQLLKRITISSRDEMDPLGQSAYRVLHYISKHRPVLYRAHIAELTKMLLDTSLSSEVHLLVIHALTKYKRFSGSAYSIDAKVSKRAAELAKGDDARIAKQAATLMAFDEGRTNAVQDLVDYLTDQLDTASPQELVPLFAALARLARYARDYFEPKCDAVVNAALQVLTRPGEEDEASEEAWFEEDSTPALTRARVLAVEILQNRCLAYANTKQAGEVAKPIVDTLWPLLKQYGGGQDTYSLAVSSKIRLAAALAFLKLLATQDRSYNKGIIAPTRFETLSHIAQDQTFEVRESFLRKLLAYLRHGRMLQGVAARFNMVLFLVAHEPEDDLKEAVLVFARARRRLPDGERQILWELPFVRLIHLLAHHPDLDFDGDDVDPDILKMGAKYLEEYLEIFATAENISFLYSLASKLKTVRDRQDRRYDRNLYLLSELSQYLIRSLGARHSWPIPTYPAQIALPTDIFEAIKDDDECRRIVKKTYLDEDVLRKLEAKSEKKRGVSAGKKRAPDGVADGEAKPKKRVKTSPSAKKKAGPAPKRKAAAAKKKKVDKWNSDAEDEEDELSSEASDEDEADSDAGVVARLTPKRQSAAKTTRGQRGGLRSHQSPSKKPSSTANKGKGKGSDVEEEEDPNDDKMSVDSQDDEEEEEVAKPSSRKARAANGTAPRKSPAKPKKQAVKASPVAKKNGKKVAAASESAAPGKTRRALRGLAEPRKLKKAAAAVDELSDIGESGSDDEDKENESE
ncbi:hypothetical protein C6P46_002808 [Rhodotorula mucilaginosa]|uniref:Cohesin-associated protein Pds5 n=1 Tax=Rhodotorula mucilaginosa TaxID=5537 RepID=A0A9P6W5K9_RHOMI|nr:hypothetical protein C6P46_002808 [Rhodotorula mucilaginosa]